MQNSNPTILNVADLPTRLRPASSRKSGTYRGGILALTLSSLVDPTDLALSPYGSEESDDDIGLMEEPIDEQEVYGNPIDHPEHLLWEISGSWSV